MDTLLKPNISFAKAFSLAWKPNNSKLALHALEFNMALYYDQLFEQLSIPGFSFVERAVVKRKAEFLAGRLAVQKTLDQLGEGYWAIGKGDKGEPLFPNHLVGSISHTSDFAIAVLAQKSDVNFLGIDVERIVRDSNTAESISKTAVKSGELEVLGRMDRNEALTLVFSAKESVYKALFPLVRNFFGFEAARVVSHDEVAKTVILEITEPLAKTVPRGFRLSVNYHKFDGRMITFTNA